MGNVNMPTPVAAAGAALCLLGGYVLGVVAGPETSKSETTAEVESYDRDTRILCLVGEAIESEELAEGDQLCGEWRRQSGQADTLSPGDEFRFVVLQTRRRNSDDEQTYIFGDKVG